MARIEGLGMIGKRITGAAILIFSGGGCLYIVLAFVTSLVAAVLNKPIPIEPLVWIMIMAMLGLPIGLVGWIFEQIERPRAPRITTAEAQRRYNESMREAMDALRSVKERRR